MQVIIDAFGAHLGANDGMFIVKLPDKPPERLPVRRVGSIFLQQGVGISTDAMLLALSNDIQVVFTEKSGKPKGQLWNSRYGSIATVRRNQLKFTEDKAGLRWIAQRVQVKIRRQADMLSGLLCSPLPPATKPELLRRQSIEKHWKTSRQIADMLDELPVERFEDRATLLPSLRGWEGTASRHFFKGLALTMPEAYIFGDRTRQPAKDPFNAVLNYLFGMLYGMVERALIRAGVDPFIGVMHVDQYNRPVMVYDFIEPYRNWAETVAWQLFSEERFEPKSFEPHNKGIWLSSEGKQVVVTAFWHFLEEPSKLNNKHHKRIKHIELEARSFARALLLFAPPPE